MTKRLADTVKSGSAQRLRETLATMVQLQANGDSPPPLTATTLCERAGLSRNALYRYYPDVVQALHTAQQQHHPQLDSERRATRKLRQDNAALREQLAKLAALVDHYFAAWQETCLMLQRRERELADLRRDAKVRVVSITPEHRSN